MKITDDTTIEFSVSGRMQTLSDTWGYVCAKYLLPFFGDLAASDAKEALESVGKWSGTFDGETLYLRVGVKSFI